jgi:cytoskeletal protein CcmA (bactofilin family)
MAKSMGEATPNCIIGEGSVFEGRYYINGSILIEGKFKGDIKTNDELVVGPSGRVKTDIVARKVTIAGTLIGNIIASEEVILIHTGKILGDITTPKLTIEPGVITEGKVTITSDNSGNTTDAVRKIVSESYGKEAEEIFASLKEPKKEKIVVLNKEDKKN